MSEHEINNENLEKEYSKLANDISKQIDIKTEQASLLLEEAIALSDKHAVPFFSRVIPHADVYIPKSFEKIRNQFLNKFDPGIKLKELTSGYNWNDIKNDLENDLEKDFEETKAYLSLDSILGVRVFHQPVAEWDCGSFEGWGTDCWDNSSAYC